VTTGDDTWIRCFQPAPHSRARLVCLPHAGGSASYYLPFAQALDPDLAEVLAVQYPGRQDRRHEPCIHTIEGLADAVAVALRPWLDKPIAVFGHSMGALVAFELVRRLERADAAEPLVVFVSSRRAPGRHRDENVHLRDDAGIVAEVRTLGGTNTRLLEDDEVVEMIMPALRADYTAVETYRRPHGPGIAAPLVVLAGTDDPRTSLADARAWSAETTGPFDLRTFPGGHFYLEQQRIPVVDEVATRLRRVSPSGRT
jgi:surfactin synthase thioesterase subunit